MVYKVSSDSSRSSRFHPAICSERNLAFAVLKLAWREAIMDVCAVNESSRSDYSLLKEKAIQWISSDDQGFLYWCQLADISHTEVRVKLNEMLRSQNHTV